MLPLVLYFLVCFLFGSLSWALHWGPASQVLVLLMGLAIFPLQKYVHKATIASLGFRWCTWGQIARGLALPVILLGSAGLGDLISGTAEIRPLTALHNPFSGTQVSSISGLLGILALNGAILFLLEFVTEELMFRGYLLGKLLPLGELKALGISSMVFCLWHLPIAVWGAGFSTLRAPLYLVNMLLLGASLSLLFMESRSLIPVAAFHALWNSLEYNLFGFMDQQALFVGKSRVLFDPEQGFAGTVVLMLSVTFLLWRRHRSRRISEIQERAMEVPAGT
jgi:membrane protease YdiL (CAAX protease family)